MIRLYALLLGTMLLSCKKEMHSATELSAYVADEGNGYCKKSSFGQTSVRITYHPTDLLVAQELANNTASLEAVESLRKKYSEYYYFIASFSKNGQEALNPREADYSEVLNILSFHMGEFVTLTTASSDTLRVADFHLTRTFGMATSTDLLFAFNKSEAKDTEWIQFNLNEFGLGLGNQRFRFDRNKLEHVPQLKF